MLRLDSVRSNTAGEEFVHSLGHLEQDLYVIINQEFTTSLQMSTEQYIEQSNDLLGHL